jgi:hypothetical protein
MAIQDIALHENFDISDAKDIHTYILNYLNKYFSIHDLDLMAICIFTYYMSNIQYDVMKPFMRKKDKRKNVVFLPSTKSAWAILLVAV